MYAVTRAISSFFSSMAFNVLAMPCEHPLTHTRTHSYLSKVMDANFRFSLLSRIRRDQRDGLSHEQPDSFELSPRQSATAANNAWRCQDGKCNSNRVRALGCLFLQLFTQFVIRKINGFCRFHRDLDFTSDGCCTVTQLINVCGHKYIGYVCVTVYILLGSDFCFSYPIFFIGFSKT